ncbi:MAG: DUF3866 family protein [Acidimicrobiales bacterium]|jgi:hypothetical protein|nr:DUF3866 family protein [Acidimicrobiales bacterium]
MPRFSSRTVDRIVDERDGLQKVILDDGSTAYSLVELIGAATAGDHVVVNTTAVDLDLGTGGSHVIHWITDREGNSELRPGRIIKARYLSEQTEVDPHLSTRLDLDGARVLLCVLHSHLGAVAVGMNSPDLGYLMTDQAALPLALSDLVAELRQRNLLGLTVTAGQAFGGDLETINVASGIAALLENNHNGVVVAAGPGHVGTGIGLGFSSLELAGHAATLSALGAEVAVCVRASDVDPRERHNGISHHMNTILKATPTPIEVPIPHGAESSWITTLNHRPYWAEPIDIADALNHLTTPLKTMGRPLADDALACSYVGASVAWLMRAT